MQRLRRQYRQMWWHGWKVSSQTQKEKEFWHFKLQRKSTQSRNIISLRLTMIADPGEHTREYNWVYNCNHGICCSWNMLPEALWLPVVLLFFSQIFHNTVLISSGQNDTLWAFLSSVNSYFYSTVLSSSWSWILNLISGYHTHTHHISQDNITCMTCWWQEAYVKRHYSIWSLWFMSTSASSSRWIKVHKFKSL